MVSELDQLYILLASRAAALLCTRCEMWSSKRDERFLVSEYRCMGASPARSSIAADLKLYHGMGCRARAGCLCLVGGLTPDRTMRERDS